MLFWEFFSSWLVEKQYLLVCLKLGYNQKNTYMCITKVTLLLSVFNVGTKIGQFASRQKFLKLKKRSRQLTKIWELVKLCVLKNVGVPWRRRVSHCLFLLCFGALFLRIFWMIATTRNCWKCFLKVIKKKHCNVTDSWKKNLTAPSLNAVEELSFTRSWSHLTGFHLQTQKIKPHQLIPGAGLTWEGMVL